MHMSYIPFLHMFTSPPQVIISLHIPQKFISLPHVITLLPNMFILPQPCFGSHLKSILSLPQLFVSPLCLITSLLQFHISRRQILLSLLLVFVTPPHVSECLHYFSLCYITHKKHLHKLRKWLYCECYLYHSLRMFISLPCMITSLPWLPISACFCITPICVCIAHNSVYIASKSITPTDLFHPNLYQSYRCIHHSHKFVCHSHKCLYHSCRCYTIPK